MPFQYIFWDNDGVLVDTERYYLQASREALAKARVALSETQFTQTSLTEGRSVFELAKARGLSEGEIDELRAWRDGRYAELLAEEDLALAGVGETLAALHGRIGMAIVTGSRRHHFDIIHGRTGFLQFFDFWMTREDYVMGKPSAEPYLAALQRSKHSAENVLVIEDSPRGLAAAKAAGLHCWVIPGRHTSRADFKGADRLLAHIAEIPELLL